MKPNPAVTLESQPQWTHPVQAGPTTLLSLARDPATLDAVLAVLERLVPDAYVDHMRRYYALGRERFGAHWGYADQLTVLHAAARLLRPQRYLEIGVFRGRSLAVVAAAAPDCDVYAFDLWVAGYAGLDNAGPELVRDQLRRVGHRGACHIESGDSHATVPRFLAQRPELDFDLVTVDGDHTEDGARRDIEEVLPRLRVGGALVFDDVRHPRHPWLERVWEESVAALPSFAAATFSEVGHGVALAVRRAGDDALLAGLRGNARNRVAQLARALDELRAKREERIEILETEMAHRLAVIQRQGTELGRIPALEAELAELRKYAEFAEADRAKRLDVILRQGDELGRLRADVWERLVQLRARIQHRLVGGAKSLRARDVGPLLDLVKGALERLAHDASQGGPTEPRAEHPEGGTTSAAAPGPAEAAVEAHASPGGSAADASDPTAA